MNTAPLPPPNKAPDQPSPRENRSVASSIPYPKVTTRDQHKLESLRKRRDWSAWLSGRLLTKQYREMLGPAIYLLAIIVRDCDWQTGRWRGTVRIIGLELDISERQLTEWLQRIKRIDGLTARKLIEGTEVQLPSWLIPSSPKTSRKLPDQPSPTRRFPPPQWQKKVSRPEESRPATRRNGAGPQDIGSLLRSYVKPRLDENRRKTAGSV